jgi:hypothetical protein
LATLDLDVFPGRALGRLLGEFVPDPILDVVVLDYGCEAKPATDSP